MIWLRRRKKIIKFNKSAGDNLKKWVAYNKNYSNLEMLMRELNVSEITARLLINRNINTVCDAEIFLNPDIKYLRNPYEMKDIRNAVCRIEKALKEKEKICIYGDYDVDGITSVAMLYRFLIKHDGNVFYYIPNRIDEGYGLNNDAINKIIDMNVDLIITVDCGIKSVDEVKQINEAGIDIIITDHHECGDSLPKAYAIINPNQDECNYAFKHLAGGGVTFRLICALCDFLCCKDEALDFLDLTALATVADVVPLIGENRIIVKSGIEALRQTNNIGLNALMQVCGINPRDIDTYHLGFILAPRINAAGRMKDANIAVELLTTDDKDRAYEIAKELDESNSYRQTIENNILESANSIIEKDIDIKSDKIIVIDNASWHVGVIGIVASRITEKYNLPTIVISVEDGIGKGSARSIPGFNIYEAISKCEDLIEKYGGHELAAGVTIRQENINPFRKRINQVAREMFQGKVLYPEIHVDYKLDNKDVLLNILEEIEMLKPFGAGNPIPLFVYRSLRVTDIRTVGNNNKHLFLYLNDGKNYAKAIGFNLGYMINHIEVNQKIDIICSVGKNVWNGAVNAQLHIKDIRLPKS